MISVILPTYERVDAVMCCLVALGKNRRILKCELDVIIVDDSDINVVSDKLWGKWLEEQEAIWDCIPDFRYIRSSPPRAGSFTAGRARNIGAANARGDLLVFVDQDVMLAPDCLQNYCTAYQRHGDGVVYVGLYHWLRRIDFTPEDVRDRFFDVVAAGLRATDDTFPPLPMDVPGLQGRDHRAGDFGDIDYIIGDAALGAHSGNIGYPRKLFLALGGFDEAINRHGGEDADLGLTAKEHGASFLLWEEIWGVHRWHGRNQKQNALDVQANIEYIDRKHGIGQYAEAHKWMDARDWADPRHYHKDVGGVLMQADGDNTVWVCRDGHRMGLARPEALKTLGFHPREVVLIPPASLDRYEVEGVIGE